MTTLLIDTDIQDDVDDVGALAVACALIPAGAALAGVVVSTPSVWGARAATAVLRHYGCSAPVAVDPGVDVFGPEEFARGISRVFGTDRLVDFATPVATMRAVLAEAMRREEPLTIVAIGFHGNLAALMNSHGDGHSDLAGRDLIRGGVDRLVVMGGSFGSGGPEAEYNFAQTPDLTAAVFEEWPGRIDVVPWEVGAEVVTGSDLLDHHGLSSPVTLAYLLHSGHRIGRPSWDPITVLAAARHEVPGLDWSAPGTVQIGPQGESAFTARADGEHRVCRLVGDGASLAREIDRLLYAPVVASRDRTDPIDGENA
jgi:inosine-uridine nucleoside N-ribohydrolase